MIAIIILYLVCLVPAIYFTKYGIREGLMNRFGYVGKLAFFLSVWIITPGFFIVSIWFYLKKKLR